MLFKKPKVRIWNRRSRQDFVCTESVSDSFLAFSKTGSKKSKLTLKKLSQINENSTFWCSLASPKIFLHCLLMTSPPAPSSTNSRTDRLTVKKRKKEHLQNRRKGSSWCSSAYHHWWWSWWCRAHQNRWKWSRWCASTNDDMLFFMMVTILF